MKNLSVRKKPPGISFIALFLIILACYILFTVIRSVRQSFVFSKKDRINIVFYDNQATVLSLGLSDKVNYSLSFDNDLRIVTPGGYERYRIGSLGSLSSIERRPEIIKNAFSSAVSSAVDYYFISQKNVLYDTEDLDAPIRLPKISLVTTLFSSDIITNSNVVDRLYLFFLMAGKRRSDFIPLKTGFAKKDSEGLNFSEEQFAKRYKGFFYERFVREEAKTVKIAYTSYAGAKNISRILEGEGTRIVDLTKKDEQEKECAIEENGRVSKTAQFLSRIFKCPIVAKEVAGADIQIVLGERVEDEWE